MQPSRSATSQLAASAGDGVLLYEQCVDRFIEEISSGQLGPGSRLLSERALASSLGFTRLTVRRSLKELARRGLIDPTGTRGWQVRNTPVSEPPNTLLSFTELAQSRSLAAAATVLRLETREATVDEATELKIAPGSSVVECTRLRSLDEQPIAVETTRLPLVRFPWLQAIDWGGSVHAALKQHDVEPANSSVYVDVITADAEHSHHLQLTSEHSLLRVTGTTFAADGIPISLDEIAYHPNRYRFHAVLTRPTSDRVSPTDADADQQITP